MRTIFISGLHRSGTTILNMIVGSHPDCMAVGEVANVIRAGVDRSWIEDHYPRCTCGNCTFWPKVMEAIDRRNPSELTARYGIFLEVFAEQFPGRIAVDSSKTLDALEALRAASDCTVIRIVRDVRGWNYSKRGKITPRQMLSWLFRNKALEKATEGGAAIQMGYEPLVFDTRTVVEKLCDRLSLEFSPEMLEPDASRHHILVGNPMRVNGEHRIRYDSRWMQHASLWPVLLWPVMKYNREQAYSYP